MFSRAGLLAQGSKTLCEIFETQKVLPVAQCVRWRKRRWAPVNASKLYYVRKPTPVDNEEWAELKHRYSRYNVYMKALKSHFKEALEKQQAAKKSLSAQKGEEESFALCIEENRLWNAETGQIRESRQAKEGALEEEQRLQMMLAQEENRVRIKEQATRRIIKEQEEVKHFINVDNLDEEIEKALNMRVSYNFAIDLEGNRYIHQPDGSTSVESGESPPVHMFDNETKEQEAEVL